MFARDVNPARDQVQDPIVGDWHTAESKIVGLTKTRLQFADFAVQMPHEQDVDTRAIPD